MPRVKGGTVTRRRRKKVLKLAKGYFGSKHTLFKVAKQQVMKSGMYAFRDRLLESILTEKCYQKSLSTTQQHSQAFVNKLKQL